MNKIEKHPMYPAYLTYNRWVNKKNITDGKLKVTIRSVEQVQTKMDTYLALAN